MPVSSMDEEVLSRAVHTNAARGLPQPEWETQSGTISVCGNGPSLREIYPRKGAIAALNGAWRELVKKGVMPNYIIAHDPAPENLAWFKDAPDEPVYLLASCMDPRVFDLLAGKKIQIWHVVGEPEAKYTKVLVGGGFTIGCRALNLLNLIGFKNFELYGYDSSYSLTGEHHATPQNWNITPPHVYTVDQKNFLAEPWMAAQVQEFMAQIEANRFNYTVNINGGGMLKAALDHNTLNVLYDLNTAPGSYDFLCAMVNVENHRKEMGYSRTHIHFKPGGDKGFRPHEALEVDNNYKWLMLNNVARPLVGIFGFQEVGEIDESKAKLFTYLPRQSLDMYRETGQMAEYQPSAEAAKWADENFSDAPFTITLREAQHWEQRNSNVAEWVKFAKTLPGRVIFIRDTVKANDPIEGFEICPDASVDINKRLALYQRARMNFSVCNGPIMLAAFTRTIPYMYFITPAPGYLPYNEKWQQEAIGLHGQYPWFDPDIQRVVRADDTFENISKAYQQMSRMAA